MGSSQDNRKDSSQSVRKDLAYALDRAAIVLIGIYIILFIAAVIPPNLSDPRWPITILDSLRTVAYLPLIGGALILLANHLDRRSTTITQHRNWVRKFAPLAALGFFLIIPLQGFAYYNVFRMAKSETTQKISKLERAKAMIRYAQDENALQSAAREVGIQNIPQSNPIASIVPAKEQLLAQVNTETSKLQFQSDKTDRKILQGLILQWIRDAVVALLYGFGFGGLSKRRAEETNPPFRSSRPGVRNRRRKEANQESVGS